MAPELGIAYVAGLPATASLTALHAFLFKRKMNSLKMRNVQTNLGLVGKFWSDSEGKIKDLAPNMGIEQDKRAYYRTVLWLGIFCFGLSWIGFFLQLLVMLSIRYLARPRLERKVFESPLAETVCEPSKVRSHLSELTHLVQK